MRLTSRSSRSSRSRSAALVAALPLTLALCVPAGPAQAADEPDPPFVGWTTTLPPMATQFNPSSSDDCAAGRITCVAKTIRDMERRLAPLDAACDHSAVFALAYLRTTETYEQTARTAGFYNDPAFVNHEDITFAELYVNAYDDWAAGRRERVPQAWRIALDAGAARQVSGNGNLMLGMNAHVNRDLPFVLAAIGLVAPDGSSRKPDHDQINRMLNRVVQPLVAELADRYDPSIERMQTPYGVGYTGLMQVLLAWRENAWRAAEQLVAAPDAAARARVAAGIEESAAASARALVAQSAYTPPLTSTTGRDEHCAARSGAGG